RTALKEISSERRAARSHFPFGLGRQPFVRPARKGIGLVKAHMADGSMRVHGHLSMKREGAPTPVLALPILRRLPAAGLHRVPSCREPELRPPVAAIVDELH